MSSNLAVPYPTHLATKRGLGMLSPEGPLLAFNSIDYRSFREDFRGDALNAIYPAAKTNGTGAAVTFTEHDFEGLDLVSGTDDDGYAGQGLGMQWDGDQGILFEAIVTLPAAITTMKFEVGLSDADDDAGAVNVKATPTATAGDYAVFVYDTDDDAVLALHTAKAGTIVAREGIFTPAANDVLKLGLRIDGDNVQAWVNGNPVQGSGGGAGIEGATNLTPWFFCQARAAAASRTLIVNRYHIIGPAW